MYQSGSVVLHSGVLCRPGLCKVTAHISKENDGVRVSIRARARTCLCVCVCARLRVCMCVVYVYTLYMCEKKLCYCVDIPHGFSDSSQ